nr:MAG TPA: hypothetical protein [Microviridae sp.]
MDYSVVIYDKLADETIDFHMFSYYFPYTEDFLEDVKEYCSLHDVTDFTIIEVWEGF